jgi:hypothetical protein
VAASSSGHLGDRDRAEQLLQEYLQVRTATGPISLERVEQGYGVATPDFRRRMVEGLRKAGWGG